MPSPARCGARLFPRPAGTATRTLLSWCVLGPGLLAAAERVPIAALSRPAEYARVRLSPDGGSIAFLQEHHGRSHLCVLPLAGGRITRFRIGSAPAFGTEVKKEVVSFRWLNDERLLVTTSVWDRIYGVAAVDRDGRNWTGLTLGERNPRDPGALLATETVHVFKGPEPELLMLDRRNYQGVGQLFPHVLRVHARTGRYREVLRNPGNVIAWMPDEAGVIRLGLARDAESSRVLYRENGDAEWSSLPLPNRGREKLRALGFDAQAGRFYVAGLTAQDRWTIFPFDLAAGVPGEPLLVDPEYDVTPEPGVPAIDGLPLARVIFSESRRALVGVAYVTEAPRVRWFDPEFVRIQAAIDQALPETVNLLAGLSRDDRVWLVLAYSDRDPGTYYVFNRQERSFRALAPRMPWIKPAQMSPTYAIKYPARDEVTIRGYLTVPRGHEMKQLPLVVLPHGGPWVRDVWGFDPLVQLLASRGYGVLQMNYRGSRGYGSLFSLQGRREIGRAIQRDIEDGTRWAIATGVADPERIAILGGSFGGYSALFAAGRTPELYRCAVSIAGVTDWLAIFGRAEREEDRFVRQRWINEIGDPEEDETELRAMSPLFFAEQITLPVLLVHGADDGVVPVRQARMMARALEQVGRPAETLYLSDEGHSISSERARTEMSQRIVDFLERHLGPGLPWVP